MKILKDVLRVIFGLTFVFSGFVKGLDPLGSTYKFTDYFNAFGTEWATTLSFILAIVLSFAEFAIGIAVTFNYRMKISSWFALLFMSFFLPLTLFIAIKNPVTDCGCFGDALVITNWQTFYKNIVLMAIAIVMVNFRKKYNNKLNIHFQNGYFIFFLLVFGFMSLRSYNHLPLIDFRPYKIGVNINEGMSTPENASADVYKSNFVYRNKQSGKEKKFDETNYPWKDTLHWEYVSMDSKLIKKGYEPPIHNFTIENEDGEDVKDFYLYEPEHLFVLIAYNLDKSKPESQEKINTFATSAMNKGYKFICLTASTSDVLENFKARENPPYEFFFCDDITLKTIVRSNPGLLLLKEGTILNKWHWKDIPKFEKLMEKLK